MKAEKPSIGINDIVNETNNLIEAIKGDAEQLKQNKVSNILKEIINSVEPLNYRQYCDLESENDKLQKKHFLVATIEVLLKETDKNGFSLCRKNEFIYLFNSEYWENIEVEVFKDFLGDIALKMGVYKFDAKHHQFKDELYKQFLTDAGLKEIKPNNKTTLINLQNGTFEITSNKQSLREFRKSDFMTYQLPFNFDANATAPIFETFINEVLPEAELQNILAEYLGYIFIKNSVLKLEKVMLLYGKGANGKSVVFEILMALLGNQNVCNYSLQSLTSESGYQRAMLSNKLLNYASEINGKLESNYFKLLISGEPVEARLPYGNPQIITDYARFMFNCNELPKEVENTTAFFRRFIILPFRTTIPEHKQDKDLAKKIIDSELSGVFNWVLAGLSKLIKTKEFTDSDIVKNEVLTYKKQSDSALMFLEEENLKPSVNKRRPRNEIYTLYKAFCLDNGNRPLGAGKFYARLRNNGFDVPQQASNGIRYIYLETA